MSVKIEEIIKNQKILVVDDNKDILHLFKKILSTHGYNVTSAENGYEALKMAFEDPPDLILLDLALPKMDGFTVCKKLKESVKTSMIPVVIVTCRDTMKDKILGLQLGADDYITKPIYYVELLTRVESLLKLRELQKQLIEARKLETLAQIAVSVNHEINNPLCSISANAEMLKTHINNSDDAVFRKIDIILKEVDRIKQVISKLSNATRVISMEYISGVKMLDLNKSIQNNGKDFE
jgi:DNA-binding response OmpR family regulator